MDNFYKQFLNTPKENYLYITKNKIFKNGNLVYVPLPFNFSTNVTEKFGLPLIALNFHEVRVTCELASVYELINFKKQIKHPVH